MSANQDSNYDNNRNSLYSKNVKYIENLQSIRSSLTSSNRNSSYKNFEPSYEYLNDDLSPSANHQRQHSSAIFVVNEAINNQRPVSPLKKSNNQSSLKYKRPSKIRTTLNSNLTLDNLNSYQNLNETAQKLSIDKRLTLLKNRDSKIPNNIYPTLTQDFKKEPATIMARSIYLNVNESDSGRDSMSDSPGSFLQNDINVLKKQETSPNNFESDSFTRTTGTFSSKCILLSSGNSVTLEQSLQTLQQKQEYDKANFVNRNSYINTSVDKIISKNFIMN